MSNVNREWLILRHVEHEHIGTLAAVLDRAKIRYRYTDLFRHDSVPKNADDIGGLVVMGGPMGVYESDRYPFLKLEQTLIRQSVDNSLPVLGICLGAQLIASALDANVYPGPHKEIGWYPVEVTARGDRFTAGLPASFMGFHWHGDTFDLPAGAIRLFRSGLYENQGFRFDEKVLAVQFHFEVSALMIGEWLHEAGCQAELAGAGVASDAIGRDTDQWAAQLERLSQQFFERFLA